MKNLLFAMLGIALNLLRIPDAGAAGFSGVPRTGQTKIFHHPSAYDLGDDGATRAGVPLTGGARFHANGDGTVTDHATGLMWQQADSSSQAFGGSGGGPDERLNNWDNAFYYVAAMNKAGYANHRDWRLPNIKELISICNLETFLPASFSIFKGFQPYALYWSSTSFKEDWGKKTHWIYQVQTNDGSLWPSIINTSDEYTHYVKAVRSTSGEPGREGFPRTGQTAVYHPASEFDLGDDGATRAGCPSFQDWSDFVDNGDGTIKQISTNLVWQKADSSLERFGGFGDAMAWKDGFAYIAAMNEQTYAGYKDWRLPNYFELINWFDFAYFYPTVSRLFSSAPANAQYWSSNTVYNRGHTNNAWYVNPGNGGSTFKPKTEAFYVRAVRGGICILHTPSPQLPTPTPLPSTMRGLPRTGQTTIYHPAGGYDLGDDASTSFGYPLAGKRLVADSDGTVTDYATGLMWQQKDSTTQSFGNYSGSLNWEDGFAYVAAMNSSRYASHSDWRIPNIKELSSLINYGSGDPAIYQDVFSSVRWWRTILPGRPKGYWGSTTHPDVINGIRVFQVDYTQWKTTGGNILVKEMADNPLGYVRAVRSLHSGSTEMGFPKTGQTVIHHWPGGYDLGDDGAVQAGYPLNGSRFVDLGNETAQDRATGLTWQQTDSVSHPLGRYNNRMNWEDAFTYVSLLNKEAYGGHSGWRLPNIVELGSLGDYSQFCPAVPPILQNHTRSSFYWTSTTLHKRPTSAVAVHMSLMNQFFFSKTDPQNYCYVRAVLGGPGYSPPITPLPFSTATPTNTPVTPTPLEAGPTPSDHLNYGCSKTGQITIYHPAGGKYDLGDDGRLQVGYPVDRTRFEDLGNGTIIDWGTGLMWQQSNSQNQSFGNLAGLLTWEKAFEYVERMNQADFGNFSDWRLPNAKELLSTCNLELIFSLDPVFYPSYDDDYWTSTCPALFSSETHAFYIRYGWGYMLTKQLDQMPPPTSAVRAVRSFYTGEGNPGFPSTGQTVIVHPAHGLDRGDDAAQQAGYPRRGARFIDNNDGTVTDRATGLMWQQGSSASSMDWESAFNYIRDNLNTPRFAGYTDWRLPNRMELISIVDYSRSDPAIDPIFMNTASSLYWSATTCKQTITNAWAVSMGFGYVDQLPKTRAYFVRGVRGKPISGLRPSPSPASELIPRPGGGTFSDRITPINLGGAGLTRIF